MATGRAAFMTAPVDLERIAELVAKLDKLCREAQELRSAIAGMTARVVTWPESGADARPADRAAATPGDDER